MKVILPSLGILGTRVVDLRPVRFDDLRAVNDMNQDPEMLKTLFTKRLIDSVDLNKITKYDLEYLYLVSAFSVAFNTVGFKTTCPKCGKEIKSDYDFAEAELQTLQKVKLPIKRKIDGVEYSYHLLSAQQHCDALDYAMAFDNPQNAYADACAAFTLGRKIDEVEDFVKDLSASVYFTTFLFQQCCFHGVKPTAKVTCSDCGSEFETSLKVPVSMITVNITELMNMYASVSDKLSFDNFLSFTVPEFKLFVDSLNSRMK